MDLQEAWEAFLETFQEEIDALEKSGDEEDKTLAKIANAIMDKAEATGFFDLADILQYESHSALERLRSWGYA